jgi:CBS domain containing-hemolysin-like protein
MDCAGLDRGELARPALLVPDSLPVPALLDRLREAREDFAVVVDEYGSLAGIVTVEDIAEELFGAIVDENDPAPENVGVELDEDAGQVLGSELGPWTLPASWRLHEIEHTTGVRLPEGPYKTLSGLILYQLGRFAEPGDCVELDRQGASSGKILLTVLELDRLVPGVVRIELVGRSAAGR